MDIEQKWNIPEESLKVAFNKLEIDSKYYPLFDERATKALNDIAIGYEPEQDEIDGSVEIATTYILEFVKQIRLGHSELWSDKYACNIDPDNEVNNVQNAYDAVKLKLGKDTADNELILYANSLYEDPIFVEAYIYYFHDGFKDPDKTAKEYTNLHKSLIEKGKSPIYAKQYSLQIIGGDDPAYCELYASKFEESINKGRDEEKSRIIANAYKDLLYEYWPEEDNYLGIEGHKGYMKGFEYAIDNGFVSPYTFAEEYKEAYLHSLFPNEKEPPCRIKGEYDDIIIKLLADKV